MGVPVMIAGESGSGKTYSIKNLNPDDVGIFLCEKNRLPFRKQFPAYKVRNMKTDDDKIIRQSAVIQTMLRNPQKPKKIYIIDDSQYIMANEFFDRASETGFQKFTDIGCNFRNLIHLVNNELPDDVIVYFLHHPETDGNTGKLKAKTIGKLLDEKLTLEGSSISSCSAGLTGRITGSRHRATERTLRKARKKCSRKRSRTTWPS